MQEFQARIRTLADRLLHSKRRGLRRKMFIATKRVERIFDRIYYKRLVRRMKEGDVLFITELGSAREKLHGDFRAVAIFDQTEKRLTLWCWIWICLTRAIQVIWFIPLW